MDVVYKIEAEGNQSGTPKSKVVIVDSGELPMWSLFMHIRCTKTQKFYGFNLEILWVLMLKLSGKPSHFENKSWIEELLIWIYEINPIPALAHTLFYSSSSKTKTWRKNLSLSKKEKKKL